MSLSTNTKKILELFNKMQKAIINFEDLTFPHEYIAFEIYKIHTETLMIHIEDNITVKLSLALFSQLFENDNDFNECTDNKANYINLLIAKLNAQSPDDEEDAKNDLESEIITVLFNIKKKDYKNVMKNLITKLKNQLKIKIELYYLILILLVETGFNLHILIDYLPQILKEKYPYSTFDFSDVLKTEMKFDEFIKLFLSVIDIEENYDYATFQFNKETKNILVSHKSMDEITNIVLSGSSEKKNPKKKSKKGKNIENKIIDKPTKERNKTKIKNNNEKESKEKSGEKEKDKINNIANRDTQTNNQNMDNKGKSDENKNVVIKDMRKILKENYEFNSKFEKLERDNEKIKNENKQLKNNFEKLMNKTEQLANEIELLKDDKKQLKNDIKTLEISNKNLNKNIKEINCSLSNKVMKNKKKIAILEFYLKTIGLQNAYKSFIDLLIIIMDLELHGNLETKIASISNVINNLKNKNIAKIKQLLKDTYDLLIHTNNKPHYINFNEDIIKQMIFNLSKFYGNKEYLSLIDILKRWRIENEVEN